MHARLSPNNELRLEVPLTTSPETSLAALLAAAERWLSLSTSKTQEAATTPAPVNHAAAILAPMDVFSLLDTLLLDTAPQSLEDPARDKGAKSDKLAAPQAVKDAARKSGVARKELAAPPRPTNICSFLDAIPTDGLIDEDAMCAMSNEEKSFYLAQHADVRRALIGALREISDTRGTQAPLRFRLAVSRLPLEVKGRIMTKLDRHRDSPAPQGDNIKYCTWVDTLLSLPLGEVLVPQPNVPLVLSMTNAKRHLDSTIFGHVEAKAAILERFYMWLVAPLALQRPLAFSGVPGNGKTTLIRDGLCAIMSRPFAFISLGGSTDSSSLLGHGYTYEGSTPGRIVEHLVSSRCVNPIFYFDELDKCSATPKGDEIINTLVHFTDPQQSDCFRDRYVGNLDIDVSRSLSVFSFNDASRISHVLLDRLQVIHTDTFDAKAQAVIAGDYLVPQVLKERGLPAGAVSFASEALLRVAKDCAGGGVRALRAVVEQTITKVLMWRDTQDADLLAPLRVADVVTRDGRYIVLAGLERLLAQKDALPPGMYT